MTIKKIERKKAVVMGKKPVVLETALTIDEKAKLKKLVKEKTEEIYN